MKLEFLYTDDSYKGKIHDIKLEDSVILSHTNKSGLFIFSYEVKGENKDSARILSNIKSQVEKLIDKEKCFLLNDGASEYYNKQLYPLYNWFERELRQVIAMAAVQDGKEKTKKLAHDLEGLDFGGIYKALFTSQDFWENFKNIKRDKPLSKKDLINRINAFEEKILWDEMFTRDFSCLPDNFDKIREFSNDVMHAHNISFEKFKESYLQAATTLFGSGWCWVVYNPNSKKLEITQTSNAQTPITQGLIPVLVVDVWEHAYYVDYRNARPSYLEKFFNHIHWDFVSKSLEWAKKEGLNSVNFYMNSLHS